MVILGPFKKLVKWTKERDCVFVFTVYLTMLAIKSGYIVSNGKTINEWMRTDAEVAIV
jgi:hypothetical protein